MCGICGFRGDPDGVDRVAMLEAIQHRGPDDSGEFRDDSDDGILWFGNRRLAILDPSPAGHQPMTTPDGRFTVTYNGEIYNFREIRSELERFGRRFGSRSDTEVLLQAWSEWGPAALSRMRGMFAFALWDRAERCLWLARDRMGEKPLYVAHQGRRFLFASEVRALLASGVVDRRLDSDGLDAYLTFGSVADPYTLVEGVRAVEAGHWVRVGNGTVTSRPYWSLRDVEERTDRGGRQEAVDEVAELLRQSAGLCTVSDVPIAVLLSGGIDSSSNVVLLNEDGRSDLTTFSVIFEAPDAEYSEERWSTLVAKRFRTQHHPVFVTESEARNRVPEAVNAMDQPSWDGVNTYLVCHAIRQAGIKVAISGQGSDEIFIGYAQRRLFPWLLKWAHLPLGWSNPLTRWTARIPRVQDTGYEKLLQTAGSDDSLAAAYLAQHSLFSQYGIERLRGGRRPPQARFVREQGGVSPLGKLSRLEATHYLRNTLLRDGDQMSMANSLELRAPFVDHRLVEKVLAIPSALRAEPFDRQKPLLVDAVGPQLPSEIVKRPKKGFVLPYRRWLQSGLLLADPSSIEMGMDVRAIRDVKERYERGRHWSRFWSLQVLAAWVLRERMVPPRDL